MRLADLIIATAGSELDHNYSGAITSLGVDIAKAECFEASDDLRDACFQVAQSKPSSILSALPRLRLPYPKTWLEWTLSPDMVFCDFSADPKTFATAPPQVRAGCLFDAPESLDNGRMFAALDWIPGVPDGQREPHAIPFAVYFEWAPDRDMTPMLAECDRIQRNIKPPHTELPKPQLDDVSRARWPHHMRSPDEQTAAQNLLNRAITIADYSVHFAQWWKIANPSYDAQIGLMAILDCLWEPAMAFIVMLNAQGAITRANENLSKLNLARNKKGRHQLKEFVVTHLNLSRVAQNRAAAHGLDRAAARHHLVRGHFKVRKSGIFWWSPFVRGSSDVAMRTHYSATIG